jgi:hypothetical protein
MWTLLDVGERLLHRLGKYNSKTIVLAVLSTRVEVPHYCPSRGNAGAKLQSMRPQVSPPEHLRISVTTVWRWLSFV